MADRRVVTSEQGQALAAELGIPFVEASAKTSVNVEETFIALARQVKTNLHNGDHSPGSGATAGSVNVKKMEENKNGCC